MHEARTITRSHLVSVFIMISHNVACKDYYTQTLRWLIILMLSDTFALLKLDILQVPVRQI